MKLEDNENRPKYISSTDGFDINKLPEPDLKITKDKSVFEVENRNKQKKEAEEVLEAFINFWEKLTDTEAEHNEHEDMIKRKLKEYFGD